MPEWSKYPTLGHIPDADTRHRMERRRRLRKVRYALFRLQTQTEKSESLDASDIMPPGFVEFWLTETAAYQIDPRGKRVAVPPHKAQRRVVELGGYASFAKVWDVDEDLLVYLRHRSVWQEWATKLQQVVPVLGEE